MQRWKEFIEGVEDGSVSCETLVVCHHDTLLMKHDTLSRRRHMIGGHEEGLGGYSCEYRLIESSTVQQMSKKC